MARPIGRREFVGAGAIAGLGLGSTRPVLGQGPTLLTPGSVKPVVIASANGNWYRNGGKVTAVERAHALITRGGDVLDALIAGVNLVELDPEEESVGYGGVPNADGVVQLDARQGRDLRRHHDERPVLQDPGPSGRLADPGGGAVRRRPGGRRRFHGPRRSQPLRALVVPRGGGPAPRHAPQRRRDGGVAADPQRHGREAVAQAERFSVCTENGPQMLACDFLLPGIPEA